MGLDTGSDFTAFRKAQGPALYGELRTSVTEDVLAIGLITAFTSLFVSFLVSLPSASERKKRLLTFGKVFIALYISLCILLSIFGYGWRVGSIYTETQYRQFTNGTIHAQVGIKFGLYGVNITLKGTPVEQLSETIDYNEHVSFGDREGRLEFSNQGGSVRSFFRESQERGAPLPILWIMEYLTLDGEAIRWNRQYREAGYFASLLLWTALCLWFVTVASTRYVLIHTAFFASLTGVLHMAACFIYEMVYNHIGPTFAIPFEDDILQVRYGWGFFLTLINGVVLLVGGAVMAILSTFWDNRLNDPQLGSSPTPYHVVTRVTRGSSVSFVSISPSPWQEMDGTVEVEDEEESSSCTTASNSPPLTADCTQPQQPVKPSARKEQQRAWHSLKRGKASGLNGSCRRRYSLKGTECDHREHATSHSSRQTSVAKRRPSSGSITNMPVQSSADDGKHRHMMKFKRSRRGRYALGNTEDGHASVPGQELSLRSVKRRNSHVNTFANT
eukprot:scpid77604/ scgid29290/ Dual oxidase maturation factor 1; Dual oxidase activator 1; Numb-interacting protein